MMMIFKERVFKKFKKYFFGKIRKSGLTEIKPKIGLSKCNEELFKYDAQFKLPAKISQLIAADAEFKKFPLIMGVQ